MTIFALIAALTATILYMINGELEWLIWAVFAQNMYLIGRIDKRKE